GRALVTEGALVGQGEATLMARIQQLDPIYADFTQTAAEALRLRDALKKGTLAAGDSQALTLRVEGTPYQRQGALQFADVEVDRGTGQIALRGKFTNPDGVLLPGMYVRVRTPQGIDNQAILVPQRAVRRSSDGSAQVMVVGADERAEARSVGTGVMQGSRWQITEGLEPGDRVIVGGLAAVQPGVKIVPKPDGAQTQAQSSVPQQ
ncbi:TPA: multidrug efflux RND transporter periplasmic adaptor subunit MexC, partial [Pseudomonas aeruginosa]